MSQACAKTFALTPNPVTLDQRSSARHQTTMLHFTPTEFDARLVRAQAALSSAGLDGILLFAPESHFWQYTTVVFLKNQK